MKTRSRTRLLGIGFPSYQCSVLNDLDPNAEPRLVERQGVARAPFESAFSHIVDEVPTPGDGHNANPWGVCYHFKYRAHFPSMTETGVGLPGPVEETWVVKDADLAREAIFDRDLLHARPSLREELYTLYERFSALANVEELRKTAMMNFRAPGMGKEGFSLLNFLWELPELATLAPSFRKWSRLLKQAVKGRRRLSCAEALDILSEAKLTWDFGIAPFIRDVATLMRVLANFDKAVELLHGLQGKNLWQTLVRAEFNPDEEAVKGLLPKSWYPPSLGGRLPFSRVRSTISSDWEIYCHYVLMGGSYDVYRIGVGYDYGLPEASSVLARVKQYLDALGVKPDLSIVWNAVPFTFLLDWCVGVSNFLEANATNVYPVDVTVKDLMQTFQLNLSRVWTARVPLIRGLTTRDQIIYPTDQSREVQIMREDASLFERTRTYQFDVRYIPEIESRSLKLRHIVLGGALAWALGRRGYTRHQFRAKVAGRIKPPRLLRHHAVARLKSAYYARRAISDQTRKMWKAEEILLPLSRIV